MKSACTRHEIISTPNLFTLDIISKVAEYTTTETQPYVIMTDYVILESSEQEGATPPLSANLRGFKTAEKRRANSCKTR